MGKDKQKLDSNDNSKGMAFGVPTYCAAELKLLLTVIFILCSIVTLLQFLPSPFSFSPSDLRFCTSRTTTTTNTTSSTTSFVADPSINSSLLPPLSSPSPPSSVQYDQILPHGIIKRLFHPYGSAAYNFIIMGAYRGGLNTFAIIGLSSKPLHLFAKPTYQCEWLPQSSTSNSSISVGYKILPDWGYGRVYTVVVVNCTFPHPINSDNSGGKLVLHASTSGGGDANLNVTDSFEVLAEAPGNLNISVFTSKPKYDHLYCGSSLYGNLSPQRVREWIAYHIRLFGERSHFVIHDAGGIHDEVKEVLKPWMELGYVTLQDIREQERFDGYYHNQFLVVNDCLHRYKFMAKWMFFFDIDEYIYVPPSNTINSVLDSLSNYSQFTIGQMPMSGNLCLTADDGKYYRKWGFEKLVYRDVKKGARWNKKYAIQPRSVYAAGVHMSQNVAGKSAYPANGMINYYHYHGTIAERKEPCQNPVNATYVYFERTPYVLDSSMRDIASPVKEFELKMIGSRLQNTRQ